MKGALLFLILLYSKLVEIISFQPGNVIPASTRSLHDQRKTEWTDVSLPISPKFAIMESVLFHADIPQANKTGSSLYTIDPQKDFKVSFIFGHSIQIPWITVFNAEERKCLRKLIVTFTRDEFEVLKVKYKTICKYLASNFLL